MALRKKSLKHLLQWLVEGTRGGVNRARIINALSQEPYNANQLGKLLKLDYRTIRHHLDFLEKNKLVTSVGERYGKMYFLSSDLEENFDLFEEIWNKIGKKLKKEEME
jgi:DNA-binding transcriptional ArsR family regulator